MFQLPHNGAKPLTVAIGGAESVMDLKQMLMDTAEMKGETCFSLAMDGKRLDESALTGDLIQADAKSLNLQVTLGTPASDYAVAEIRFLHGA